MALLRMSDALAQVAERSEKGLGTIGMAMKEAAKIEEGRMKDIATMRDDGASVEEIAKKLKISVATVRDILGEGTILEFTDKQIKMAYGILNDPRYKGGNYSGAYKAIEKIAKGLASHPSVANALKRANEDVELENSLVEAFEYDLMEFTDAQLDSLAKSYASLKGKTISIPNANKLRKIFDRIPDSALNRLRKKKIPFVSGLALSRMIQKKIPVTESYGEHSAFFIAGVETEETRDEVQEDIGDDYLRSKLNDTQIANIKKLWQTKKPSDVTPAVRKMVKGFDEPTKIAISHANINVLSKLAKEEVELREAKAPFRISYSDKYGKHAGFEDGSSLQDIQNKAQKLRAKGFKIDKMGRNTSPVEQKLPEPEGKQIATEATYKYEIKISSDSGADGPDKEDEGTLQASSQQDAENKAEKKAEKFTAMWNKRKNPGNFSPENIDVYKEEVELTEKFTVQVTKTDGGKFVHGSYKTEKEAQKWIDWYKTGNLSKMKAIKIIPESIKEVSPPGWEGSVRAMKDNPKIDNPYALAWSMKNKGDKPHYKDKDGTPVKKDKYKNEGAKSTFERLWHKRGDKVKQ